MAQDLDIPQFFKRAPKEWLRRYFAAHGALVDFDWPTVGVRKVDGLLEAFQSLHGDVRGQMVEDFENIKLLATPIGKVQIIDEAGYHQVGAEVAEKLANFSDVYECAFYVLLEQKECWDGALSYAVADAKSKGYWRKRINLPRLGREPTLEDADALATALTELFRSKEGRGDYCSVRPFRRGDREYYFAYSQDHKRNTIQYHDGEMAKRPYKPAFEVIFVHNDGERTLAIWHHGQMGRIKDLQQVFATTVLKQEIARDSPRDDRVYDLDCFLKREFKFQTDPSLGIAKVEVRKIGINILGDDQHIVSIDLGADTRSHVLSSRIEAVTTGLPPTLCKVARVGCRVTFEKRPTEESAKSRKFELAWPNSCSLQNDALGLIIQRMLADNRIEPKQHLTGEDDGSKRK